MKLIPLIILTISLAVDGKAHEHFTFPPHFQMPHSGMFTSEKNPYLPPEAHTPHPYFPMNNINKLPFPYLPPTATKAPFGYPSPFPLIISSTLRPHKNEDDDDDEDDKPTSPLPPFMRNKINNTERIANQRAERREMRPVPKNFQHPIDRIDTKMPFQFNTSPEPSTQNGAMQNMASRSIMISDIQRDHNIDQMKAAGSFPGVQYVPQPGVFISSTTETAIPILRLSNEMDLDGSFSYEALGADQTHYVQHSRMENAGTGKDEQVVEGSYSYVGDNGKTYTVHYIADANGFRASGDHLPVAPPIPEIIQRAVQYNLAEESKKPPHLKSWNGEENENEVSETEKRHQFAVSSPRLSSLFTGKTPESFSHSFSQASNTQNNLVAAASSQTPIQTVIDFTDQMQTKQNSGTISPQITFLASQGAHVPSVNTPQQTIGRIFTTEKSTMPQLINYEAKIKDSNEESNKALWRWQYGLNANANQNMEKNSISRSFGADDIVINFNDMTPDQYTNMIKQQLEPNTKENLETPKQVEKSYTNENGYNNYNPNIGNNYHFNNEHLKPNPFVTNENNQYSTESMIKENMQYTTEKMFHDNNQVSTVRMINDNNQYSTERIFNSLDWNNNQQDSIKNYMEYSYENTKQLQNEGSQTSRPKLITQKEFIPRSQTVTQTYNYDEDNFESRRTKILNSDTSSIYDMNLSVIPLNYEKHLQYSQKPNLSKVVNDTKITVTQEPTTSTAKFAEFSTSNNMLKFTDFIVTDNKNDFKPVFKFTEPQSEETTTTTTESNIENVFEENIFLKNLFMNTKNSQEAANKIMEDNKNIQVKPIEARPDKHPKFIQYQTKPQNEIKLSKKKPIDMAELLNYISRNQFESNKLKSKPKPMPNNYKQKNEVHYYVPDQEMDVIQDNNRNHRTLQQQEELRGVIKNYKVLHRNNNFANVAQDDVDGLRRNLSPPPMKPVNLPPLGRAGPSMKSYLPPIYV